MKRALVFMLSAGIASPALVASGAPPARSRDINRQLASRARSDAEARRVFEEVSRQEPSTGGGGGHDLCAIAVVPGPANGFNIRFGVFNTIFEDVGFMTLDSFRALDGNALIHESVFSVTAPSGGTANVEYPTTTSGKGPVVMSFTGFVGLTSASFNTDPDTYDDPAFGATVGDLDGTVIELAYDGGRRCRGTFKFNNGSNASVARVFQSSP